MAITSGSDLRIANTFGGVDEMVRAIAGSNTSTARIGFYDRKARHTVDETQAVFCRLAFALAAQLRENGVASETGVVVACPTPRSALLAFLASSLIGSTPTILSIRPAFDGKATIKERIAKATDLFETAVVVTECASSVEVPQSCVCIEVDFAAVQEGEVVSKGNVSSSDDVAYLQQTSGSTGSGKAVAVTRESLLANLDAIGNRCEYTPYGVFVGWLPLYHDMGLVAQALSPMAYGMDMYLMSPFDFLADPAAWLRLISEKRGTVSASPNFGYELVTRRVTDTELASLDLSSWKSACCGAEPISPSVARAFIGRFAACGLPTTSFTPCYGLAEATLAVTMTEVAEEFSTLAVSRGSLSRLQEVELVPASDSDAVEVVSLGKPVAGIDIRVVNSSGLDVGSQLVCGEILLSGTSVAKGWVTGPNEIVDFREGLATGDVGFVHDGNLYVVERTKNILIRNGQNFSASLVENAVAKALDISADRVLVIDEDIVAQDHLVALVEVEKGETFDLALVLDTLPAALEPMLNEMVLVKRGALPRTTSGKKQHLKARLELQQGTLPILERFELVVHDVEQATAVPTADYDPLLVKDVVEIVSDHVKLYGVTAAVTLMSTLHTELDIDSLGLLELAMNVEAHFSVSLSREVVAEFETVGDIVDGVVAAQIDGVADLSLTEMVKRVRSQVPQYYTVVEEAAPGRRVRIEDRWFDDFASGCYLGLDEDASVVEASAEMTSEWGLQRGWTRAVATPRPLIELETRIANLIGVPDVMVFGTVTLLHFGVLPLLAGPKGSIIIDTEAHKSMHEASALARAKGTFVTSFKHGDTDDLEAKLIRLQNKETRIVVLDGVYSMRGSTADLKVYQALAEKYDALLYVDDAHGFGMLGDNPNEDMPYGYGGTGAVRHLGCTYDRIIYVGGLTKAYSAMLAFVTCPNEEFKQLFRLASTMIFVHAPPTSTLAQAHAVLDINEQRGDVIRADIYALSRRLIGAAKRLGFEVKTSAFPIVNVIMGDLDAVIRGCQIAWKHGALITPAVFPAAPLNKGGLRFTVTATNTHDQIDRVIAALEEIAVVNDSGDKIMIDLTDDARVAALASGASSVPTVQH